ncbi:unnamed protein product [Alternaria alternata]
MAQELYSVYRTQSEYDVAYLVHPPHSPSSQIFVVSPWSDRPPQFNWRNCRYDCGIGCEKPSGDEGESGVSDEETAVDEDESVTDSHGNLDIIDTFTHPREAIEPQVSTPRPIEYDSISRTPPQDQFIRGRISKCMIEPMSKETSRDRHDMMFAMKVMYSRQGNKFWKKERDPLNLLQGIRPQKGLRGEYLWIDALCIDQTKSRSHKVEAYRTMFSEKHAMNDLLRHSLSQHSGASYRGGDYCLTWDIHLDSGWKDMDDREPRKWEHDTPWSSDNEKETAIGSVACPLPCHFPLSEHCLKEQGHCHYYHIKGRITRLHNVSHASLMEALQELDSISSCRSDKKRSIPRKPYGIVYMRKRSWCNTFATVTYAIGQIACCLTMRNYELCQGRSLPNCGSSATSKFFLDKLWVDLNSQVAVLTSPLLAHRESPSTFLFGLSGLLYATAVMLQYRVNRRDVYQYLCVPIGIMTGVFVLVTSTCFACEGPTVASTLALCVSVVMMLSVSMHTVWRTLISSRTAQLQHKINKWMEESELESAGPEKRVLFYEIS